MSLKKQLVLKCLVLFIVVSTAVGLYCFIEYKRSSHIHEIQSAFKNALGLYHHKRYADAIAVVDKHLEHFIEIENGCELMLSVYAESREFKALEKVAMLCLKEGKGKDIAHEALAYSLSEQGEISKAITILEREISKQTSPRIEVALSRLYLLNNDVDKASQYYLHAVETADVWSMWVTYALKQKQFAENASFIERLVKIVSGKKTPVTHTEAMLLEKAKMFGLHDAVSLLEGRIAGSSQSN